MATALEKVIIYWGYVVLDNPRISDMDTFSCVQKKNSKITQKSFFGGGWGKIPSVHMQF